MLKFQIPRKVQTLKVNHRLLTRPRLQKKIPLPIVVLRKQKVNALNQRLTSQVKLLNNGSNIRCFVGSCYYV